MPPSAGRLWRNWEKASSPPAEAPTPTTGKSRVAGSGGRPGEASLDPVDPGSSGAIKTISSRRR